MDNLAHPLHSCDAPLSPPPPLPKNCRAQEPPPGSMGLFLTLSVFLRRNCFHGRGGCRATIQACGRNVDVCCMMPHACLSLGVHLSMCFTVRQEMAYIPWCTTPEFSSPRYGAAHGRAQGPPLWLENTVQDPPAGHTPGGRPGRVLVCDPPQPPPPPPRVLKDSGAGSAPNKHP